MTEETGNLSSCGAGMEPDDIPDCDACSGTGRVEEAARLHGANPHSACVRDCDECDGSGRAAPPTNCIETSFQIKVF